MVMRKGVIKKYDNVFLVVQLSSACQHIGYFAN